MQGTSGCLTWGALPSACAPSRPVVGSGQERGPQRCKVSLRGSGGRVRTWGPGPRGSPSLTLAPRAEALPPVCRPLLSISERVPESGSMAHRGPNTRWCSSPRPVPERLLSEACPPRPPHPPLPILILPGYSSRLEAVSGESELTPPQRSRNAGLWSPAKAGSWPPGYCRGACRGQHAPQPPETAFLEPNVCLLCSQGWVRVCWLQSYS